LAWLRRSVFAMTLALVCFGLPGMSFASRLDQAGGRQTTPESASPEANKGAEDANEAYRHSVMVQKMGAMLGMNADTAATTFEVVNFAILAVLLGYGLLKTLPKTFRDRTSNIQKQLVDARAATEEASVRLNSVEDRLAQLDAQIADMKAQAERDAIADYARIKTSIEEESKKILASAEQEIASAQLEAQRQLQRFAAELAIEQAARKLVVTAETDRLLVQGFARRLGADSLKGGEN
jgi:F-type H+-transporting ATPase subunit b